MDYLKSQHRQTEKLLEVYNEMAERLQLPNVLLLERQNMQPKVEPVLTQQLPTYNNFHALKYYSLINNGDKIFILISFYTIITIVESEQETIDSLNTADQANSLWAKTLLSF